jgi:non-specific protein-tyrosine kinase
MAELYRFKGVIRWWWLMLISAVIAAGISYYVSSQQPRIYQTTTTLMVGQAVQKTNPGSQDFYMAEQLGQAYAQMVVREPVLQATIDSLSLKMDWRALGWQVLAWQVPQTQLMQVSVEDTSPERAVIIADELAYQLVLKTPTSPQNEARQMRSQFVVEQLNDLERRIQAAQDRTIELEAQLDQSFSAREINNIQGEITNLQNLINGWQTNYTNLLSFLEGSGSPNTLAIIEPATLPTNPISPNVKTNVILAAATGLMLALAAAFALEFIDNTVKTPEDFTGPLGLMALGSISRIKGKDYRDKLITAASSFSPIAETYRLVRSNIQFAGTGTPPKTILVTSPGPGEGKSVTVANLGLIMAQADFKTVVVDADLRQPMLHQIFGLSNSLGLTDLLTTGETNLDDVLQASGHANLHVITSGPLLPNPSERLSSQRMGNLLSQLTAMADVVIFDSPPVMAVTDASVLANQVDGVIMVAQAKHTTRPMFKKAVERLLQMRAVIIGGILNKVTGRSDAYYYAPAQVRRQSRQSEPATQRHDWQQSVLK